MKDFGTLNILNNKITMDKLTVTSINFPKIPVKDLLIIQTLTKISTDIYYSIFDASGKELITDKLIEKTEDFLKISVQSLKSGMYLLRLYNDQSFVVNSFSVAR